MARKLFCYIYAMLRDGVLYDKSLDDACVKNNRAKKLDVAHKMMGSRKNETPDSSMTVCCALFWQSKEYTLILTVT